jgi:hypothetical protein
MFLSMLWGDHEDLWKGTLEALKEKDAPRVLLFMNEPNLKGQAFIPPKRAAEAYLRLKAVTDPLGIRIVGPQMAIGSPPGESVTAWDPLLKTETTYTYMIPYLDAFKHYLGGLPMPDLGVHPYGNLGELKWSVEELASRYGVKVWVTEFNPWKVDDPAPLREYLAGALDFLENSPRVGGYAWFMARLGADSPKNLLAREPGKLTALGDLYVNAPGPKEGSGPP